MRKEEESFKLQSKITTLEMRVELNEINSNNSIENQDIDWNNKYESMAEDFKTKIYSINKDKEILQQTLQKKDSEIHRITN